MNKPTELIATDIVTIAIAAHIAQCRADALKAAAVKAAKELAADEVTQRMLASFRKQREISQSYEKVTERTQAEVDAEMSACMDADSANWINSGRY